MSRLETSESVGQANRPSTKLFDEAHQGLRHTPTCREAIANLHDLGCFSQGLIVGATAAAGGFIEFLATPDSVNRALIATGPALDTAVDYYTKKANHLDVRGLAHDIHSATEMAGGKLTEYGQQRAHKRGEICGSVAFDMLAMELGTAGAQGMLKLSQGTFESTELASRRQAFADGLDGLKSVDEHKGLEDSVTLRRFGTSPEFAAAIDREVSNLPDHVKRFLKSRDIEVVPVRRLADVDPEIDRFTNGLYTQRSGKRFIFVAEEASGLSGSIGSNIDECERLLKHEIGHALDHAGVTTKRWLTMSGEFRSAIEADFARLPANVKQSVIGAYPSEALARKETFAEIYSYLTAKKSAGTSWKSFFTLSFPETVAKMTEKGLLDQ